MSAFDDFVRARMQKHQMGPFPTGSPTGDHRMDQVEAQRSGQYGMGVYPKQPAPGMYCYEDGSCEPIADYQRKADRRMDPVEAQRMGVYPVNPAPGMICFPGGECIPAADYYRSQIGVPQYPSGIQTPPNPHLTYGDGTGGHFLPTRNTVTPNRNYAAYESDQTGGPQPNGPPTASPQPGMDFAQLLDLMRRMRGARRPERRTRGTE